MLELKKNKGYDPKVEDLISFLGQKKIVLNGRKFKFDRVFSHNDNSDSVFQEVEEVV